MPVNPAPAYVPLTTHIKHTNNTQSSTGRTHWHHSCVARKHVYIREQDVELWERAARYAEAQRLSMGGLIMFALEAYLAEHDPVPDAE